MNQHKRVRSPVAKALQVCLCLAENPEPMRLTDIADQLDLVPSTALRIVNELVKQGWVVRDDDGRYYLGPILLKISNSTLIRYRSFARIVEPFLDRIVKDLDIMANAQLLESQGTRVVTAACSARYTRIKTHVGELIPAHHAAGGIVQVAQLHRDDQTPYLRLAENESGKSGRQRFQRQLDQAARQNLAVLQDEMQTMFTSISAAIKTRNGNCQGSVVAIALSPEFEGDRLADVSERIHDTAAEIAQVFDQAEAS